MAPMNQIIIYGSCVARDTATVMSESTKVLRYVARQSLISAAHGPAEIDGEVRLDSSFQKRGVESDFKGDALTLLKESAPKAELLLLDLMDERLGVYRARNGAYITRTWELINSGIIDEQQPAPTLIDFATDEHFALWSDAARQVIERLSALSVPTLLLAPPLADHEQQGDPLDYRNRSVSSWNHDFARYYDYMESLGVTVLRPPSDLAVADRDHQWGLAPFHYARPMYEWFTQQIKHALNAPGQAS